jgi:hypothetical protein
MLVFAAVVALTAWTATERSSMPVAADQVPTVDQSCKPFGPVELMLEARPMDGSGGIPVEFMLRPLLELKRLDWHWEVSPELVALSGEMDGEAATVRGEPSEGRLVLVAPPAGRHAAATLVVSGVFTGSDETGATFDEAFSFEQSVTWGEVAIPVPVVQSPDETGAMANVAVVPSSHTAGR